MKLHPKLALLLATVAVITTVLWAVAGMERTLRHGQPVLVKLAPVDPRSLMQGDYMALSFAIDRELQRSKKDRAIPRYAYVQVDAQGRASFTSAGDSLPAPVGQVALRVRQRDRSLSVGPNAFFFQEGTGKVYERAQWGELRVAANGKALLVGLRDAQLQLLGTQNSFKEETAAPATPVPPQPQTTAP